MSDEELTAELTRISSVLGAEKAMRSQAETPTSSGLFSFLSRKQTIPVQPVRYYNPLLSAADVQEIVKNVGSDMSEVMACISQANHGRKVAGT